jgi:hypothetical protein
MRGPKSDAPACSAAAAAADPAAPAAAMEAGALPASPGGPPAECAAVDAGAAGAAAAEVSGSAVALRRPNQPPPPLRPVLAGDAYVLPPPAAVLTSAPLDRPLPLDCGAQQHVARTQPTDARSTGAGPEGARCT